MATVLKLEHVNFTRAGKPILKDLNWEIQSGENWAVLGLNGAGKTTLLKLLHGDIWPSSGQMEVLGHIFGHSNINDLRKKLVGSVMLCKIGYILGIAPNQLFYLVNLPASEFMKRLPQLNKQQL